jgi:hypothetical protein
LSALRNRSGLSCDLSVHFNDDLTTHSSRKFGKAVMTVTATHQRDGFEHEAQRELLGDGLGEEGGGAECATAAAVFSVGNPRKTIAI